jgi:hypothetical protein
MNVKDLKPGHSIFGNKGNVWSNTAHIYKSGEGNLCGTPALSNNWARIEEVKTIGFRRRTGCPRQSNSYTVFSGNPSYLVGSLLLEQPSLFHTLHSKLIERF